MTKAQLISEISIATGYDKRTVSVIFENLLQGIKDNMGRGNEVFIRGFGSFVLKSRKDRVARDILKRTSVYVPAHCVPDFKPAKEFRDAVHDVKKAKKK